MSVIPTVWGGGDPDWASLECTYVFLSCWYLPGICFWKVGSQWQKSAHKMHDSFLAPPVLFQESFTSRKSIFPFLSNEEKHSPPLVPDSRETGTFWIKVGWMSGCNLCFWFLALAFQSFRNFFMDPSQMSERSHMKWFITVYLLISFATWSRIKKV